MDHDRGDAGLPEFGAKPWAISFDGDTEDKATRTLINPFDGSSRDVDLPVAEGTMCLRCFGDWSLMFHDETKDCFLLDLGSLSKVALPPLLEPFRNPGCALSSPTPPDWAVVLVTSCNARFLLYCRPGDSEWSKLAVDDGLACDILGSRGRIYAASSLSYKIMVINMLDPSSGVHVEEMVEDELTQRLVPPPNNESPLYGSALSHWVDSGGEVFLLRLNWYGYRSYGLRDVDVHRFDTTKLSLELVESIGDRTIFVAMDCVAVSPATAAGTEPDCVYLMYPFPGEGLRLYTIRLREKTITFSLVPTGCSNPLYWAIPQSFRMESSKSLADLSNKVGSVGALSWKSRQSLVLDENRKDDAVPWSTLTIDYIELVVPKLSFIDYLRLRATCRYWSKITKPIQDAKAYPMLMSICSNLGDKYHLFDPMTAKEYNLLNQGKRLFYGDKLLVVFSKCGWVLIAEGRTHVTAVNPFTKEAFEIPPSALYGYTGTSFSSVPTSPDFVVLMVYIWRDKVSVSVWHAGDEDWTYLRFELEDEFSLIYSNPVFFEGEFYCLGSLGNLAVFNPCDMKWRVLDKPECIYNEDDFTTGNSRAHLVEFRGELIAVFVPQHETPIEMFKFDRSHMVWTKLERLDGATMFVDKLGCQNHATNRGQFMQQNILTKVRIW
ncbi:hypothetical protein ACP70R_042302 [Stipagrostis hirtigluma subsp. patula]